MAGIKIPFLSDVRDFLRGTKDIEDAIEDVVDSLDDVGDAGDDAGKETSDAFDKAAREGTDSADKLERKFRDAFDTVRKESKDAGTAVGRNIEDGTDKAASGFTDLKDEAGSSGREAAASFGGEFEDISDFIQETAANAFGGFGPLGAAAGVAAAVGIGLAQTALQGLADKINESKEEAAALATEVAEGGKGLAGLDLTSIFREWSAEIQDARSWWELWQDDAVTNIENVIAAGERAKDIDLGEVWSALNSPDVDAAAGVLERYTQRLGELRDERERNIALANGSDEGQAAANLVAALDDQIRGYEDITDAMRPVIEQRQQAEQLAREMLAAENDVTVAVVEQAEELRAQTEAQAGLAEVRRDAIDATRELFDAETNYAATLATTSEAIGKNSDGLNGNTEQGRTNRDALLELSGAARDQASAMAESGASVDAVSGYLTTARTDFLNAASAAGLSADEASNLADQLLGVPSQVATDVTTTAKAAQSETSDYISEVNKVPNGVTTTATINVPTPYGAVQAAVDAAAAAIRRPTVIFNYRMGQEAV